MGIDRGLSPGRVAVVVGLAVGQTVHAGAVGIHDEDIVLPVGIRHIGDLLAVGRPDRGIVVIDIAGKLFGGEQREGGAAIHNPYIAFGGTTPDEDDLIGNRGPVGAGAVNIEQ